MKITYSTQPHPHVQWVYQPQWIPQCFLARLDGKIVTVIARKNSFSLSEPTVWRILDSEYYEEGPFTLERIGP